jgi:hypothetical protein
MTTTTLPPPTGTRAGTSSALALRRWAPIVVPALAGTCCLIGAITDPASGLDGEEMYALYAANPDALSVHTLALHFGYGLWVLFALLVPVLVRGRGAWLANAAALLGFLGITTLPGLVFNDFVVVGITQEFGASGSMAASEHTDAIWGVTAFIASGMPAAIFAPIIAAAALWRAGVLRWWGFLLPVVAFGGYFASGPAWWGGAIMAVALAAFSAVMFRATRD